MTRHTPNRGAAPAVAPTTAAAPAVTKNGRSRRGKNTPAVVTPAAPVAPVAVMTDAAVIASALLAMWSPENGADAAAIVATVRPLSRSLRERVTVAIAAHAVTNGPAVSAVLAVSTTAPFGRDPLENVAESFAAYLVAFAAVSHIVTAEHRGALSSLTPEHVAALSALTAATFAAAGLVTENAATMTPESQSITTARDLVTRWQTRSAGAAGTGERTRTAVTRDESLCAGLTFSTRSGAVVVCDGPAAWRVTAGKRSGTFASATVACCEADAERVPCPALVGRKMTPAQRAVHDTTCTRCAGIGTVRDPSYAVNGWIALRTADGRTADAIGRGETA